MKRIGLGIEDFKKFLDNNYYYIDKSDFIADIWDNQVTLFTRPRRFGKTLNMSMLYYFFSINEKENAYLFSKLNIINNNALMIHQNQYPVIFISFKDLKSSSYNTFIDDFKVYISKIFSQFDELQNSDSLDDFDKIIFNQIKTMTANVSILKSSLHYLSIFLEKHYSNKVILLIDEYDVPLQYAYINDNSFNGYYDQLSEFMRVLFSTVLKTNTSLEKGILTGCLRIAKESIFTGLNNFKTFSITDEASSSHFGFTQNEINELLDYYHLNDYYENLKEWYDGYLFGDVEIYNPWSTLNYVYQLLNSNNKSPVSFWSNTSGNDIVYNYIKDSDDLMKQEFELLVQGQSIVKDIYPELTYRDMDEQDNIYSFMLFTGYLRIKKQISYRKYEIVIPNKEVLTIFKDSFMKYFNYYIKDRKKEFVNALKSENVILANTILNNILQNSISFYDNYENFYHGFMVGLLAGYKVKSNHEIGNGRFDIILLNENIIDKSIVIECKHSSYLNRLEEDSIKAVKQIKDKGYIEGLLEEGYRNVIGYGISFYKKACYITKL